jgi:hypothetical protein
MVTGFLGLPRVQPTCEACILGKQHREPIPKASIPSPTHPLEIVHSSAGPSFINP